MQTKSRSWTSSMAVVAGYLLILGPVGHLILSFLGTVRTWNLIASAGFFNTIAPPWSVVNPDQANLQRIFWTQPGSFAIPLIILGCFVVWSIRQGQLPPRFLGWSILAFGAVTCVLAPVSGMWSVLVVGILLVTAQH